MNIITNYMTRQLGDIVMFKDFPEFTPNVTPLEMFQLGVFGGTYWRPIHSGVLNIDLKDQHLEFSDISLLPSNKITNTKCNPKVNYYGVSAGSSLSDWEGKGWIKEQDPYGWVQWYCRFYDGRRSADDVHQIDRWLRYAGVKGRWKSNLEGQIRNKGSDGASKVVRQGLLQWAFVKF
jgi:hypothetical protein